MMADLHLALSDPSALVQSIYASLDRTASLEPEDSISAAFKSLFPDQLAIQQVSASIKLNDASTDSSNRSRYLF